MDDCGMNNIFAHRLKTQQAIGCLAIDSLQAETNQENEGENYPTSRSFSETSYQDGPKSKKLFMDNDLNSSGSRLSASPTMDRFIPTRKSANWETRFFLLSGSKGSAEYGSKKQKECSENGMFKIGKTYKDLLKNEILGSGIDNINEQIENKRDILHLNKPKLFHFNVLNETNLSLDSVAPYSLSPIGPNSHKLLRSYRKSTRYISKSPFKVLDAPELRDDFYLNLVDWSSRNFLSVGLGNSVYQWSAKNGEVTHICEISEEGNSVSSISWNDRGNMVAVGTNNGYIEIWDVCTNKQISKLLGHSARVGTLAWANDLLTSGSRDRLIFQRDMRSPDWTIDRKLIGHKQEVCGLKWSPDLNNLASGGNDNKLCVWNMHSTLPIQVYKEHTSAVKAIAWSPHHHGLLASGGGTADRCIRFWNTLLGQQVHCRDTGSQVCNLVWSKNSSELVSTHGYGQFKITIWKYPSLNQVSKLTGHSSRVLYLAMSPDGQSIVTGGGDETLRIWHVFPPKVKARKENKSLLNIDGSIR